MRPRADHLRPISFLAILRRTCWRTCWSLRQAEAWIAEIVSPVQIYGRRAAAVCVRRRRVDLGGLLPTALCPSFHPLIFVIGQAKVIGIGAMLVFRQYLPKI